MPFRSHFALAAAVLAAILPRPGRTQEAAPTTAAENGGKTTIAVDAKLVMVPALVFDKKGLVGSLHQNDFALTLDGKPQTIRYFDHDNDVPLTVGLLVDVSRSQTSVLDEEQKASQSFLDSFLQPGTANRPADKAFVLQFAHGAELLQDVTDSHKLLANGLKEIGTQAGGEEDASAQRDSSGNSNDSGSSDNSGNSNGGNSGNGNSRGGYGPYGRRGGSPSNGGGNQGHEPRATGGTVLYDSLFLASNEVLGKQKGRRAVIVLTDGVDRHSKESLKEAIEAAQRADTVVYAIYCKGKDRAPVWNGNRGYGGYGGYDPYGRYPPTTGGSTDPGTYKDPDGRKILERIASETGGRMFELKGKGSVEDIYRQIGDELRAQYRLGFTPSADAGGDGFHTLALTLTNPSDRHFDIQTRNGVYLGAAKTE